VEISCDTSRCGETSAHVYSYGVSRHGVRVYNAVPVKNLVLGIDSYRGVSSGTPVECGFCIISR
jgi:hypothetical protein